MYYPKTYFVHLTVLDIFRWTNKKATRLNPMEPQWLFSQKSGTREARPKKQHFSKMESETRLRFSGWVTWQTCPFCSSPKFYILGSMEE